MENGQDDAGQDGQTRLARPDFQAQTGIGKQNGHFPCSADHDQDWQSYPVDPCSAILSHDHRHMHTVRKGAGSVDKNLSAVGALLLLHGTHFSHEKNAVQHVAPKRFYIINQLRSGRALRVNACTNKNKQ